MKGLSTILAMILIVIIVVALIGLTYTFSVQLFQTSATGASNATQSTTQNLQKTVDIISANCYNTTQTTEMVNFTVRATGLALNGELSALWDGVDISSTVYETNNTGVYVANKINTISLAGGQVKGFSYIYTLPAYPAVTSYHSHILTITAPAGDVPQTLTSCATVGA